MSEATSVKELELDLIVATQASDPPDRNRPTSDGVATPGEALEQGRGPARRRPPDHGCDRSD